MITLKNKRRRMLVFNLDAPHFIKTRNETRYGKPCAMTFLALEKKTDVNEAVLSCAEVKVAIAKGDLRVLPQAKPELKPEPVTSAALSSEYED